MSVYVTHEPSGVQLFECPSIRAAEEAIAKLSFLDPAGVAAGNYGIDADENANAEYNRQRQKEADHIDGYDRDDLGESPDR